MLQQFIYAESRFRESQHRIQRRAGSSMNAGSCIISIDVLSARVLALGHIWLSKKSEKVQVKALIMSTHFSTISLPHQPSFIKRSDQSLHWCLMIEFSLEHPSWSHDLQFLWCSEQYCLPHRHHVRPGHRYHSGREVPQHS